MLRFTLDTNCIIHLEQRSAFAESVTALVAGHVSGSADVAVPAVAASERQAGGHYLDHFDQFTARLEQAGLGALTIVEPIAVYGVAFYGHGYYADQGMTDLQTAIHRILHPNIEPDLADFCANRGLPVPEDALPPQWRNALCDTQILWSHVFHKRDCFVSTDRNFFKATKLPRLLALGAGRIALPNDAATLLAAAG